MCDEFRKLMLQFIGSLTLADHLGDVCNDIQDVLDRLKVDVGEWNDLDELRTELAKIGVTTLAGDELL